MALPAGTQLSHELRPDRHAWLQVARGKLTVNGLQLHEGDGAAVSDESHLELDGVETAEVLLFDLA